MRKLLLVGLAGGVVSLVALPRIRSAATDGWEDLLESNPARRGTRRERVHSASGSHVDSAALTSTGTRIVTESLPPATAVQSPGNDPGGCCSALLTRIRGWIGGSDRRKTPGHSSGAVAPGSLADSLGLKPGDRGFLPDGWRLPAESLDAHPAAGAGL